MCHAGASAKSGLPRGRVSVEAEVAGDRREYRSKWCSVAMAPTAWLRAPPDSGAAPSRNEYAIDMMEETPYAVLGIAERDRMYVYYGYQGQYGYGYVFPKTNHVNLGIGCKLDHYLSTMRGEQYAHHRAFVDGLITETAARGRIQSG